MNPPVPLTVLYVRGEDSPEGEEIVVRMAAESAGASFRVEDEPARGADGKAAAAGGSPEETAEGGRVILVGPPHLVTAAASGRPAASILAVVDPGAEPDGLRGVEDRLAAVLHRPLSGEALASALRHAGAHTAILAELLSLRKRAADQGRELRELNRIGVALSAERDVDALLSLILTKCREITSADAGSVYLVERKEGSAPDELDWSADKVLVFRLAQNDSLSVPFRESRMDISRRSLAGYAALTGEPLSIEDAYAIPPDAEYQINRAFDAAIGYRTRSLLVIPMINHKDEVIGVLQLINRKRDPAARLREEEDFEELVISFDARTTEMAFSLASQAAVAIENARLYEEIQILFEGFIRASVTAIESRDPTTSGHSERVAVLTVGLAELVDREEAGPLRAVRFTRTDLREIRYASLLHDFGKIGVRENVLVKEKKLYGHELRAIQDRFRFLKRTLELKCAREKIRCFMERTREEAIASGARLDAALESRLKELDRYLEVIVQANEPAVLKAEGSALLRIVAGATVEGLDEEAATPLLQPWEFANLAIGKGSLSPEERREIESHVTHTFEFLATIPWTRELRQVPVIAHAHHEKLDGTGYPRGVGPLEIPLESRMMTISDIYDALTAQDRPYKRSIPAQRALEIIAAEVKEGKVDKELFRIFVEGKIYERVLPPASGS